MQARRVLPFAVICISALCSAAQNDHSKAYWVKKYDGIAKMFATKNMDAFVATLHPLFSYLDEKNVMHSREEFIKNEVDPIRSAKSVGGAVKVTSLKPQGNDVYVGYDWNYWMVIADKKGDMRISGEEIGTDHWHKTDGKWLTLQTLIKKSSSKEQRVKNKK